VTTRFAVRQIDHVELFVPDRAEAADWYARLLGLKRLGSAARWADDPRGPLMISPDGGRTMIALFTGTPQGDRELVGFSRVAFRVEAQGFLDFVAGAGDLGLSEGDAPLRIRDHGIAYSAYFKDPWGNRLEVTTYDHARVRERLGSPEES
jgi:catechol 2,3-dioxygenase-like lactoylglutathione lyase family enzyme